MDTSIDVVNTITVILVTIMVEYQSANHSTSVL